MNRRSFLKALAGVAAASTTAYFLPPIGGWKSDVIAHPSDDLLFRAEPELEAALARLNAYWEHVREQHVREQAEIIAGAVPMTYAGEWEPNDYFQGHATYVGKASDQEMKAYFADLRRASRA